MRKTFLRILYAVLVFAAAVIVIELASGRRASGTTKKMEEPTLPLVTMLQNDTAFNELHGHVTERNTEYYRAVLTPVPEDRTLTISIDPCGSQVTEARAELRDLSGERLIEREDLLADAAEQEDGTILCSVTFGDLLQSDGEYLLVIVLSTKDTDPVRYYTRLSMEAQDGETFTDALDFVETFHSNTLTGQNESWMETYIEPDSGADNSTLAEVDINSSYSQIAWNSLTPDEDVAPVFSLVSEEGGTYIFRGTFVVTLGESSEEETGTTAQEEQEGTTHRLLCEEYYRLRQGTDRIYLLNYRRTAEEIYDPAAAESDDNTLHLGIASGSSLQIVQNDDGSEAAFVLGGNLYVCRASDSSDACVFSFADEGSTDRRELFAEHGIRILGIDEDDGTVSFLVYGYMNRGDHEGETGIALCFYSPDHRTLEERAFLSFDGSFEMLQSEVEGSAYLNSSGRLYLPIGSRLYEINVKNGTSRVLETWSGGESASSEGGQLIAFPETENGEATGNLVLEDLQDLSRNVIEAGEGETLSVIGFLGEDLIYGVSRQDDAGSGAGAWFTPMYAVRIVDQDLNVLKDYEPDGYLISEAVIDDNQITLHRIKVEENEDGTVSYTAASDDAIVGTDSYASVSSAISESTSDLYETVLDLTVSGISGDDVRYVRPRFYVSESREEIDLTDVGEDSSGQTRYYVYGIYGYDRSFGDVSDAVRLAASETGTVRGKGGILVWRSPSTDRAEIGDIGNDSETQTVYESSGSIAGCLDAMLRYAGVSGDAGGLLDAGESAEQVLEENLTDALVLDLSGCTMDEILYYPETGIPVLAMTDSGENAVLIVGFGPDNIAVWDPENGTQYITREEAEQLFTQSGNRFLTYVSTQS